MNSFQFMGRLARDPELRYTPNGTAVCETAVALNHRYTTSSGEAREEVTFIDLVFWRGAAETVATHFRKGKLMAGVGRLKQETWDDPQGNRRSKLKVQVQSFYFCGDKDTSAGAEPVRAAPVPPSVPVEQDDIPF